MKKTFLVAGLLACGISAHAVAAPAASPFAISIKPIGTYATDIFGESAAEIVAHDPKTQRLFVVNAQNDEIDVLDVLNPASPNKLFSIDLRGTVNSVAVFKGLAAVAVEADPKTGPGKVVFFNAASDRRGIRRTPFAVEVEVGALPDMVTFTPDGKRVLVANEGEPNDDYRPIPKVRSASLTCRTDIAQLTPGPCAHRRLPQVQRRGAGSVDPDLRPRCHGRAGPGARVHHCLEGLQDRLGGAAGKQCHRRARHRGRRVHGASRPWFQGPPAAGQRAGRQRPGWDDQHHQLAGAMASTSPMRSPATSTRAVPTSSPRTRAMRATMQATARNRASAH
jgi:hypothetical protein